MKQDYEIAIRASDAGVAETFGKIESRAKTMGERVAQSAAGGSGSPSFGDRIKALGQSFGSEKFGKLGEVANKGEEAGERIGGSLGATAKLGGALFIGAEVGKALSEFSTKFMDIRAEVEKSNKTGWEAGKMIASDAARAIPLLGDMIKGFDDLSDAMHGRKSAATLMDEAKALDDRSGKQRAELNVIRDFGEAQNPRVKIERELSERIADINQKTNAGIVHKGQEHDQLIYIARSKAASQVAALDQDTGRDRIERAKQITADIAKIEKDAGDEMMGVQVTQLQRRGEMLQADYLTIAAKFKAERDATQAERQKIIDNPSTPAADAGKMNALRDRDAATAAAEGDAITTAKTQDVIRREAAAERVQKITRETIGLQVSADDVEGQKQLKRLDVMQRMRDLRKEIDDAENAPGITPEQRAALEARKASIGSIQARQLEDVDRVKGETIQGRNTAQAEDGRFAAGSIAARSQVEVFRDVSKHTAAHLEEAKKTNVMLASFIQQLLTTPPVA